VIDRISALEAELAAERDRIHRLEGQLRNLAENDPLTGLLNRSSLSAELEQHLARCGRSRPEGLVLVLGVDGVADIARSVGHRAADEILATTAERIGNRLRATDTVGRWGSNEIAVLLPGGSGADVAVVADALLRIVVSTGTPEVPPGSLVASIGVAEVPAPPITAFELLGRARQVMSLARGQGGGSWRIAEPSSTEEVRRVSSTAGDGSGTASSAGSRRAASGS